MFSTVTIETCQIEIQVLQNALSAIYLSLPKLMEIFHEYQFLHGKKRKHCQRVKKFLALSVLNQLKKVGDDIPRTSVH